MLRGATWLFLIALKYPLFEDVILMLRPEWLTTRKERWAGWEEASFSDLLKTVERDVLDPSSYSLGHLRGPGEPGTCPQDGYFQGRGTGP